MHNVTMLIARDIVHIKIVMMFKADCFMNSNI